MDYNKIKDEFNKAVNEFKDFDMEKDFLNLGNAIKEILDSIVEKENESKSKVKFECIQSNSIYSDGEIIELDRAEAINSGRIAVMTIIGKDENDIAAFENISNKIEKKDITLDLINALSTDKELFINYQATIAMAIYDTIYEKMPMLNNEFLHFTCNESAKRFLDIFMGDKKRPEDWKSIIWG